MSYCTQTQIEGYLGRPLTDSEEDILDVLVGGVSDFIDLYTGRTFEVGRAVGFNTDTTVGDKSSNSFERFNGGDVEIFFDTPLQTDTTISGVIAPYIGAYDQGTDTWTLLDITNYSFWPLNSKVKTSVEAVTGVFPYGITNIFVYGTFADYITAPKGIQLATATLCANFLNMTDDLKSETIEGYARVMDKDWNPFVQRTLDSYKRVIL